MYNVCCTQFEQNTYSCLHPALGRRILGPPQCILTIPLHKDPRIDISKCKIRVPYEKPKPPPIKP